MTISYNKLWKLLIDKDIKKTQLCEKAGISTNAMAKMGKNEVVKTETLLKICNTLNCKLDDILEYTE
ncbi:conserved domain protein [Clostridium sp. CAG:798]|nr:conserved domain protein [Clostridium sp. CAG:798]